MQALDDEGTKGAATIAEALVEVRGLSLDYRRGLVRPRRVAALREVSFDARRGEIVGVVGPNGSGKSSLFRSLLGLERARGDARLFGLEPGDPTLRRRIGSSSDDGLPFPEFSAREFLTMQAALGGLALGAARQRCAELLARVGLEEGARRRHGDYSSGMRQRLALAQALLLEPELLLLDEPTANLDPLGIEIVARELAAFRARGGCALVATHGLEDYEGLFGRLLVLLGGRVVAFGTPEEVLGSGERHELRLESPEARLLAELRAQAEARGAVATRLGPVQRRLGTLLADVQAERRDAGDGAPR